MIKEHERNQVGVGSVYLTHSYTSLLITGKNKDRNLNRAGILEAGTDIKGVRWVVTY